jgi:pheromone shutdown protein TraB
LPLTSSWLFTLPRAVARVDSGASRTVPRRAGITRAAEIKAAVSTAERAGFLVVHVDEPAVMLTAKGLEVARSR